MVAPTENGTPMFDDTNLFKYADASIKEEETFHFLGFEFLQRLNIIRLQSDLISIKEKTMGNEGEGLEKEKLTKLLDDYTTAIRNYNYMHEARRMDYETIEDRKQRLKLKFPAAILKCRYSDPFDSHYYYLYDNEKSPAPDFLRDKLRHWLPSRLSYSPEERLHRPLEFEQGKPPADISPLVDNLVRFFVSFVAVLALVAPMCIMAVKPSPAKSLITASIFMVVFACSLSFAMKTTNVETLVATATYSAVLVVFVGTNS